MLVYTIRRLLYMLLLLWVISITAFIIIELPPGDYLTTYIMFLKSRGQMVNEEEFASLRILYGLDLPVYFRYFKWLWSMFHGNFGISFRYNIPVKDLLVERLPLTVMISLFTMSFTFAVGIPIGIFSAVRQYSMGDYTFTVLGFFGLAIPNFLLALILMFICYRYFGWNLSGLFSFQYLPEPWSFAKVLDMLKHLPIPIIVIGTAGTAGIIRIMRGCLLDEIQKQYVITARAKGVEERSLLFKYPVRVAINPMISTIGWLLPSIVSGATITAIVLNLPTTGTLLFEALKSQDTYLAGSAIMFLSFLTLIGTFISDILLAWVDPRIRYEKSR